MWQYAIVEVDAGQVVKVETPDGDDQAALETGREKGLGGVMHYLGDHGWKPCEGTGPLAHYLIFWRASEEQRSFEEEYFEPPS